jgi:hypothetical protein
MPGLAPARWFRGLCPPHFYAVIFHLSFWLVVVGVHFKLIASLLTSALTPVLYGFTFPVSVVKLVCRFLVNHYHRLCFHAMFIRLLHIRIHKLVNRTAHYFAFFLHHEALSLVKADGGNSSD